MADSFAVVELHCKNISKQSSSFWGDVCYQIPAGTANGSVLMCASSNLKFTAQKHNGISTGNWLVYVKQLCKC